MYRPLIVLLQHCADCSIRLDLFTHVAESGLANAGQAGPWAPAL